MKIWLLLGNFCHILREMAAIYTKSKEKDKNFVSLDSDAQYMTLYKFR